MMEDYAKWIPGADKGRNLAAMNRMLGVDPSPEKARFAK